MKLSKRKEKILKAVVESNLASGEPISSKAIQQEYLPDVSSATIRNELSSLEELGLLTHLHTSGGRLPTSEGYKKYVAELMPTKKLTRSELAQIQSNFDDKLVSLHDIMTKSAKTISDVTNYTSVVYMGTSSDAIIETIKLVEISSSTTLVVVVTDMGVISEMANLGSPAKSDLDEASEIMTNLFAGKSISSLYSQRHLIDQRLLQYQQLFNKVLEAISRRSKTAGEITIAGKEKFIDYPEFEDTKKLKRTLSLLENKDELLPMLKGNSDVQFNISVGGLDNNLDCSLVTATYKLKGDKSISAGIVGPVRMDYAKAISVLQSLSDQIKEITDKE